MDEQETSSQRQAVRPGAVDASDSSQASLGSFMASDDGRTAAATLGAPVVASDKAPAAAAAGAGLFDTVLSRELSGRSIRSTGSGDVLNTIDMNDMLMTTNMSFIDGPAAAGGRNPLETTGDALLAAAGDGGSPAGGISRMSDWLQAAGDADKRAYMGALPPPAP